MTTRVVYAIDKPATLETVCLELASVAVAGAARDFTVGLVVGDEMVIKVEKLTVASVNELREAGSAKLLSTEAEPTALDPTAVRTRLEARGVAFDELIIVHDTHTSTRFPPDSQLTGLRNSVFPKKPIRAVKSFDGVFTVGRPEAPLISVGIELYPATRLARPPDTSTYINGRKVTQSSTLRSEEGDAVDTDAVQRGYLYLNELVTVDDDMQKMMNGEFAGAEPWPKAFEMLAVVAAVPPWMLMDKLDYVTPKTSRDQAFLQALNGVLLQTQSNVIARLCHEPRSVAGHKLLKGKLELVTLQPTPDGQLTCARVPFKDEFKSYYEFAALPTEDTHSDADIETSMDNLVDAMTTDCMPAVSKNPRIERVEEFLIRKMVNPKVKVKLEDKIGKEDLSASPLVDELSAALMKRFGITERSEAGQRAEPDSSYDFI